MQQTYDRKLMERFMTHPELDEFDTKYQEAMQSTNKKDTQKYFT
jgi:hypothetical protein